MLLIHILASDTCACAGLARPWYFDNWINLKVLYKQHYKREPKGGLEACVRCLCLLLSVDLACDAIYTFIRSTTGHTALRNRTMICCRRSCGLQFEGRAHSGLVDSKNTAAICIQMMRQGFVFSRATRYFVLCGAHVFWNYMCTALEIY